MSELEVRQLTDIVMKGNVAEARSLADKLLEAENTPDRILEDGLLPGLATVGGKYENGKFFLPELFSAGEVAGRSACLSREVSGLRACDRDAVSMFGATRSR